MSGPFTTLHPAVAAVVSNKNCLRFRIMVSILEHQTRNDAPVNLGAGIIIHGKNKSKPQPRLHLADGFEVDAKAGISNDAGLAGFTLVHSRVADQFKHGNE